MKKTIIWTLALLFAASVSAVEVDPNRAVIVVDSKADGVVKFAAQELQKYLHMITGTKIVISDRPAEGKYPFLFGTPEGVSLQPEEARWEVNAKYTRLMVTPRRQEIPDFPSTVSSIPLRRAAI